jgi:hypothetical protein
MPIEVTSAIGPAGVLIALAVDGAVQYGFQLTINTDSRGTATA